MSILNLVIQADAALIVGPHLAVGDGHMSRVLGVALECLGRLKGGVQHQIGVGRGQAVDVDVDLHEARNLTGQTLEARFDAGLDLSFSAAESSSLSCQRMMCFTIIKSSCY